MKSKKEGLTVLFFAFWQVCAIEWQVFNHGSDEF
jgi:hypothetical protein